MSTSQQLSSTAIRVLKENDFDWFIAHHGSWKDVVSALRAEGHEDLADLLAAAGILHDDFFELWRWRDSGEATQEENAAYFEAMRPLDQKRYSILKSL